jgi:hypothetical protein
MAKMDLKANTVLPELSFDLIDTLSPSPPSIVSGILDSFAKCPGESNICYLSGAASLLNGSCELCSNAQLKFTKFYVQLSDELSEGDELRVYYGPEAQDGLICVCGSPLVRHLSVLPEYAPTSNSSRITTLQRELGLISVFAETLTVLAETKQTPRHAKKQRR